MPWPDCAPCHSLPDGGGGNRPPSGQPNVPANSRQSGLRVPLAASSPRYLALTNIRRRSQSLPAATEDRHRPPSTPNRARTIALPCPYRPFRCCIVIPSVDLGLGLGALGGSLAVASMGRWRRGRLLIAGGFVAGLALSLVALIPVYWVAVGIMVLLGLGNVAPTTISQALIMERVEDQYRGRVMSIVMMSWSLMPVGVVPLGLAVDSIGGRPTVGIMAGALLTVSTVVLVTQRRLRQIQ